MIQSATEISTCAIIIFGRGSSNSHCRMRTGCLRRIAHPRYASAGRSSTNPRMRMELNGRCTACGTAGGAKMKSDPPRSTKPSQKVIV